MIDDDEMEAFEIALEAFNPANFDSLLLRASEEPFKVALECQATLRVLEETHEKPLNQMLAVGYCVAYRLRQSPVELEKFTKYERWSHPFRKPPEGDALLRMIFRFYKNAWSRGSAYDTACRWTVALADAFKKGVEPSKILPLIKLSGGVEQLYETEVSVRKGGTSNEARRREPPSKPTVPQSLDKISSLESELRSLPPVTHKEAAVVELLVKFNNNVAALIRQRHEEDEENWQQELDEANGG